MISREKFLGVELSLEEAFNETLACFEILRSVGFSSDEIYIALIEVVSTGVGFRVAVLRAKKDFIIDIGYVARHGDYASVQKAIELAWRAVVTTHNSRSDADAKLWCKNVMLRTRIHRHVLALIIELETKGFTLTASTRVLTHTELLQ